MPDFAEKQLGEIDQARGSDLSVAQRRELIKRLAAERGNTDAIRAFRDLAKSAPKERHSIRTSRRPEQLTGLRVESLDDLDLRDGEELTVDDFQVRYNPAVGSTETISLKRAYVTKRNGQIYVIDRDTWGILPEWREKAREFIDRHHSRIPPEMAQYQRGYVVIGAQNPYDYYFAQAYGPGFEAGATAGMGDGFTYLWNRANRPYLGRDSSQDPYWSGTIRHESGHNIDEALGRISATPEWAEAADADDRHRRRFRDFQLGESAGTQDKIRFETDRDRKPDELNTQPFRNGVTAYGTTDNYEDFAESIALYTQGRIGQGRFGFVGKMEPIWFRDIFPARAAILDKHFPEFAQRQLAEIQRVRPHRPPPRPRRVRPSRTSTPSQRAARLMRGPISREPQLTARRASSGQPYGEDVEKAIQADLTGSIARTRKLPKAAKQSDKKIRQGNVAQTQPVVLDDGKPAILKTYKVNPVNKLSPEHQRDAEDLSSLVARAVTALTPRTYAAPDTMDPDAPKHVAASSVWMNEVPGKTAAEYAAMDAKDFLHPFLVRSHYVPRKNDDGTWKVRDVTRGIDVRTGLTMQQADKVAADQNDLAIQTRAEAGNDDERLLGLLDLLIFNGDRHKGNWIISTPEGEEPSDRDRIVGIDHGNAFHNMGPQADEYDRIQGVTRTRAQWPFVSDDGWFSLPFLGPAVTSSGYRHPERTPNDMSRHDMALIRRGLEAIRPEFERRGRDDWWQDMMTRFDILEANAHGSQDRLTG
jgi:hypothetical protein